MPQADQCQRSNICANLLKMFCLGFWSTRLPTPSSQRQDEGGNNSKALQSLRLIAEHLRQISFPRLTRPRVPPHEPPTAELVNWGIQAYCLPWIRHFGVLISGMVTLSDSNNKAAVRIIGRSSFELCAHIYYVKKHLKQHLDRKDLSAAWEFLLPIATGSRYINEIIPRESSLFPEAAHISKAINCFKEVMPKDSHEDYSYLSEYCHPNMMAFMQHYQWTTPDTIEFVEPDVFGAFGAIAASAIQGLVAADGLLVMGKEKEIWRVVRRLLLTLVERDKTTSVD